MIKNLCFSAICCLVCLTSYGQPEGISVAALMKEAAAHKNEPIYPSLMLRADSLAVVTNDTANRAAIQEKLAFYYFSRDGRKSLEHYQQAIDWHTKAGNLKKAAICTQNMAFVYDEGLKENAKALEMARKAVHMWAMQNDTMQQANIYKYIGLIEGRLGQYKAAKEHIDKAILLFASQNYTQGVAVSYYDLGNVLLYEKDVPAAITQLLKSKELWMQHKDNTRVYIINTALLKGYAATGDHTNAKEMLRENQQIEEQINIFWSNRLDFYKEAETFILGSDKKQAQIFRDKYQVLNDSLTKEGIKTR